MNLEEERKASFGWCDSREMMNLEEERKAVLRNEVGVLHEIGSVFAVHILKIGTWFAQ
jgi:hypothetical protein